MGAQLINNRYIEGFADTVYQSYREHDFYPQFWYVAGGISKLSIHDFDRKAKGHTSQISDYMHVYKEKIFRRSMYNNDCLGYRNTGFTDLVYDIENGLYEECEDEDEDY